MLGNKTGAFLSSTAYVIFVYSGMIKWLPFPVDPTLLFAVLLALPALYALAHGVPAAHPRAAFAILLVLAFFCWYYLSASYTISDQFWVRKSGRVALNIMAFSFPLLCFRQRDHFVFFDAALVAFALVSAAVVVGFYTVGALDFLIHQGVAGSAVNLPDYLGIATVIGSGVLVLVASARVTGQLTALAGFAAVLLLTARGPILFLAFLMPALYAWSSGRVRVAGGHFPRLLVLVGGALLLLLYWQGAEGALRRLIVTFTDQSARAGGFRFSEFSVAFDVIRSAVFLGVGLGGYGLAAYRYDGDAYPHNLLLESFAETGLIGFTLFTAGLVAVMTVGARTRRAKAYLVLFLFITLNYMKSGGFIGARDLYMFMGVLVAYANAMPSWQQEKEEPRLAPLFVPA